MFATQMRIRGREAGRDFGIESRFRDRGAPPPDLKLGFTMSQQLMLSVKEVIG